MTDPAIAEDLKKLRFSDEKINFKEILRETNDELISIIHSLLEFNPFMRKKPEEYLEMDLFKPWRKKYPELLVPPSE